MKLLYTVKDYYMVYIKILYYRIRLFFGIYLPTNVIPEGVYCYTPDLEKTERLNDGKFYINPCPYYKHIKGLKSACLYLGYVGYDFCLGDQCKICGKNNED